VAVSPDVIAARLKERLWVLAGCVGLIALALHQDPGWITPDTKVDLTANPMNLLTRSLQMWDPSSGFGRLQDQEYGFLWPMGPFYRVGQLAEMPPWVIQRLWWALLLCVAFLGVHRLAYKLRLGTWASRVMGAMAFALSVPVLSELGAVSVEAWTAAAAPWVLVPLVGLRPGASLRRPIALSALALACAGGVNATAVFAVVPLAVLWLSTLETPRRRFHAIAGWLVAAIIATAWWVGPMLLVARYSPPSLDFGTTAAATTQVTDMQTTLRGATHWLAYLNDFVGPLWPAGYRLATNPVLIVASIVVAAFGLAGLARRGMPHRRFLITGLLIGVAMVGFGHVTDVGGAFTEWQRALLDGLAAPFRDVHTFDVLIRLPLSLGIAHLGGVFLRAAAVRPQSDRRTLRAIGVCAAIAAAIAVVATPALAGGLASRDKYFAIPVYWRTAGAWLDQHLGDDRVLVVPGSRFGTYYWGSTGDEVLQAMTTERWGVRNAVPLAPAGLVRYLDGIDSALSTGAGSPGLADILARAGVKYLLVRSDVSYARSGTAPPVIVRQALARSPGLASVAKFGDQIGGPDLINFQDSGLAGPVPPLEVFEVQRDVKRAVVQATADITVLTGGPESLLDLASAGMLPAGPAVLAGDATTTLPGATSIVTDGMRRREVSFSSLQDAASATLTRADKPARTAVPPDYLPAWGEDWLTVADYHGIWGVTASSSWAGLPGFFGARPAHQPFAAFDGDPQTSWRTAPLTQVVGQWLEIKLTTPQVISQVELAFDLSAANVATKIDVTTDRETVHYDGVSGNATIKLSNTSPISRIRFTIKDSLPTGLAPSSGSVGLAEVRIAGLQASRVLTVPAASGSTPVRAFVFSAAPRRASCFFPPDGMVCDPDLWRDSEDGSVVARQFTLADAGQFEPLLWAQPRPGKALDDALRTNIFQDATASSSLSAEPAASAAAAIDGDPATIWRPAANDVKPWLRFAWLGDKVVNGLRLTLPEGVPASRPVQVQVVGDQGMRTGSLNADGVFDFGFPMRTDEVTISFLTNQDAYSVNALGGKEVLGVGVAELSILNEARPLADPLQRIDLPCGSGPTLHLGTQSWPTRLSATRQQLTQLRAVPAILCGDTANRTVRIPAGTNEITATGSDLAVPTRVALRSGNAPGFRARQSADPVVGRDRAQNGRGRSAVGADHQRSGEHQRGMAGNAQRP
jgi:arabinofuranan 3-O-arabinosyltransferase